MDDGGKKAAAAREGAAVKTKLDSLLAKLQSRDWEPGLSDESYQNIIDAGLHGKNLPLAAVAAEIAMNEHPLTLRGLFYRVVSVG